MLRWMRPLLLLAGTLTWSGSHRLQAQDFTPDESIARMNTPPGLVASMVASEPMVRQPVAIEFDDRGRLWVIQYLQYPNPAGLSRVKVDRWSRTVYDRVPKPPPHGPAGADRITILEDVDGDGEADRAKDFVDGLNLTSSLAFGHGGVYVLNVPYLLFYPDRDRDDVPDADPSVELTGFGMQDAHSVANSLTWGPDGWLYGTQGSTVTSVIRSIEFQQGVWRYHPITKEFELFCEGGGNSWGIDFDATGQLLYATNHGGYVMLHGVQGAYYWKSFGKHGELHNPHAYGYFQHVAHKNFRGGHVEVGGRFYTGETFPASFRGKYIAADLLGHAVYWHHVRAAGSTFTSEHAGDLLIANDTWFAPTDVTIGPDGAVYVTDWRDARTAHPDPDAEWDKSNGRIVRIQAVDAARHQVEDPHERSSHDLVGWLERSNGWYVRQARKVLMERRDPAAYPRLRRMLSAKDPLALEALWTLYSSGGFDTALGLKLLDHDSEHIRAWTVRFLGDAAKRAGTVPSAVATALKSLAMSDHSVRVRSQLAQSAQRVPTELGLQLAAALSKHDADADDPHLPLLIWWAVERHALEAPDVVSSLFATPVAWIRPILRDTVLPRLMRRFASERSPESLEICSRLLAAAKAHSHASTRAMVIALDAGLGSSTPRKGVGPGSLFAGIGVATKAQPDAAGDLPSARLENKVPKALGAELTRLWENAPSDANLLRLHMRLGSRLAEQRAIALARDQASGVERRTAMLALLGQLGTSRCAAPLLRIAQEETATPLRIEAVRALARHPDESIARALVSLHKRATPELGVELRRVLMGREDSAALFLAAVERGEIDPQQIGVEEVRAVVRYESDRLTEIVTKHWGRLTPGTPEEKLAVMRRLNNELRASPGNPEKGRVVFQKTCAGCHVLFGEGAKVGPDLTHANRADRTFLLASLVDPSRVIRKEYLSSDIVTSDGRVVTGLIVANEPTSVRLVDSQAKEITLSRGEIAQIDDAEVSLMPEGLHATLTPQQIRDLFSYLQSTNAGN